MSRPRKRGRGDGTIDRSGQNSWRIRYRIGVDRFQKTVKGNRTDAQKELRRLLTSADKKEHVAPDKMTLGQWIKHWESIGCPGTKYRKKVSPKTPRALQ